MEERRDEQSLDGWMEETRIEQGLDGWRKGGMHKSWMDGGKEGCTRVGWDRGTDAEIKVPFADNPELSEVRSFKAWSYSEYSLACFTYCQ